MHQTLSPQISFTYTHFSLYIHTHTPPLEHHATVGFIYLHLYPSPTYGILELLARTNCDNTAMSIEQCFNKDWRPISGAASEKSEKTLPCFDCNICLEYANEPVVTLCGHLYCWPCIYKWFYYQSSSLASDEHPQCPVCKAEVSHTSVVPLYGRGETSSGTENQGKASHRGINIPQRPPALGTQTLVTTSNQTHQRLPYRNPYQNLQHSPLAYDDNGDDYNSSSAHLSTRMDPSNMAVQMFGEMVYARVFGNSRSLYTYPNSYQLVPNSHPRLRRQHMQADKSLGRVSLFLFCCFLLCLFLF